MIRKVALFVSLSLLTSCATPSSPKPAEEPPAKALDPRLCVPVPTEPVMPAGASIPQPVTPTEREATEKFLGFVDAALDWGRSLAERAEVGRRAC